MSGAGGADLPDRIEAVRERIRTEWARKRRGPWVVAYSGGKDSTLLLQLVWEAVADGPDAGASREIHVVGNDTLVESPLVIGHLMDSLDVIQRGADEADLALSTEVTRPAFDQGFWVNVIGRGYMPPTRNFRWCTDRMKILPTSRFIERLVRRSGSALLLIGTRRAESENRRRGMDRRRVAAVRTNAHDTISGCRVFAPLADLSDDDVWMTLMQRRPPWGGTHDRLLALYRGAGAGECPLVLTRDDAPACGTSSPRFGCWTCTVVAKDRSLRGLIDSGHPEAAAMEELFRFREWLVELREDDANRMPVRRDGRSKLRADGSLVMGPFTLEVRRRILGRLRKLEGRIGAPLLSVGEQELIEEVWRADGIQDDARQALDRRLEAFRRAVPSLEDEGGAGERLEAA